jgi:hypothetical protein
MEVSLTVITTDLHIVLLQVPSALPYTVTVPAEGGPQVNGDPVPMDVPPHEPLYHFQEAACPRLPPLAVKVTVWPKQIVEALIVTEVAGTLVSLTVNVKF